MRLLDTRKIRIDEWINRSIADNQYVSLKIVTGFLYQRGWGAIRSPDHALSVKTISSVKVDSATKQALQDAGELPFHNNLRRHTRFFNRYTQHAKLFLLSDSQIGKPDIVVIGSSNLTGPGLGIGAKKNLELNYIVTDQDAIKESSRWFDDLWEESLPSSAVQLIVEESQDSAPHDTYFAQLIPGILTFAQILENLLQDTKSQFLDYSLVNNEPYQIDAVEQVDFRLQRYGCCFLSDDVGLGKTVMGAGVIKRTVARDLNFRSDPQKLSTLLICPQQIQGQWASHISAVMNELAAERNLGSSPLQMVHIATYGQERSKMWSDIGEGIKTNSVELVLVDEAHRLRNTTNFYRWLSDIDAELRRRGSKPKYLFLTATPINNSFLDLYNLFKLALPASFWNDSYIDGIQEYLQRLDNEFSADENVPPPDTLSTFSQALSKIMIRRDVGFLNRSYLSSDLARLKIPKVDGDAIRIKSTNHELGRHAPKIGDMLEKSKFLPYQLAVSYDEMHEANMASVQADVSHVLRAHLSKSLQSSFAAGIASLENIISRCQHIMQTGERCAIARLEEDFGQDSTDGQIENQMIQEGLAIDRSQLARMLEPAVEDIRHLQKFAANLREWQLDCDSEKAQSLGNILDPEHPTLIFTEYRSTAKWLISYLKKQGINVFDAEPDLLASREDLQQELLRLDPSADSRLNNEKPRFSVYVLTDKYSEGRNFHKCRRLINYDLPWNPIRKTQRQGRIVRVGSPHLNVEIYSISYTHKDLARYANPEEILREKLRKIASVFGKGNNSDLIEEGQKFISYFVRYNRASLGGNSKAKVDALGIMETENEATYFNIIWDKIKESNYETKVGEILAQWRAVRASCSHTFVINDERRAVFATLTRTNDIESLRWFEEINGETKPMRLVEAFELPVDRCEIEGKLVTNTHRELLVRVHDKNTAKAIKQIKLLTAEVRLPRQLQRHLADLLNRHSGDQPFEFFNSMKVRLFGLKSDKKSLEDEVAKVIQELGKYDSDMDSQWVAVCTLAFQVRHKIDRSA